MKRGKPARPPEDRFWEKVEKTEGCWHWRSALLETGYGQFWNGKIHVRPHRFIYELLVGPIPQGLDVDHVCHNEDKSCPGGCSCPHRACVNPAHLRLATRRQNIVNGRDGRPRAKRTHCVHGHELSSDNRVKNGKGGYTCAICRREVSRRSYYRSKGTKHSFTFPS